MSRWREQARVLAALALLGASALGGCGDAADPRVTLDFWAMGREGEVVRELTEAFERANPDIVVRVQQIPWSAAHEKLLTAYAGDAMPDVFQLGNTWVPEFVALDAIAAARRAARGLARGRAGRTSSRGSSRPTRSRAASTACPGTSIRGSCSTARTSWRGRAIRSRRAAGRTGRTRWRPSSRPVGADADAIILPANEWAPIVILALQQGAELLQGDAECGNFRGPGFRTALAFYLAMFERGFASASTGAQIANLYQEFASGRFSMYISGPWNLGEFARRLPPALQDAWATAPLPAPDGRYPGISLAGGASLAIHRGSEHQDAAWRLVEFLSRHARSRSASTSSAAICPRGPRPGRTRRWPADARAQAFFAQLQRVRSTPKIPEWERIATAIMRRVDQVVRGDATAEAALAALDAEVDAILEKRRWLLERARPGGAVAADLSCRPATAAS